MTPLEIGEAVGMGVLFLTTGMATWGYKQAKAAGGEQPDGRLDVKIDGHADRLSNLEAEIRGMRDAIAHSISDEEFSTHTAMVNSTLMELKGSISELIGEVKGWRRSSERS